MKSIDFNKDKPDFDNGTTKWYFDTFFQNYLKNVQADNLPKLNEFGCFVVKGDDIEDYVLIDDNQNIIAAYPHTSIGKEQMLTRINIMKISKHFHEHEQTNV